MKKEKMNERTLFSPPLVRSWLPFHLLAACQSLDPTYDFTKKILKILV